MDDLDDLIAIATGRLEHIYQERCPDALDWDARDPTCVACQAIMRAEGPAEP